MGVDAIKVLVVDDEQLLLFALERAFRGRSLDIDTALNFDEAIAEIENKRYDLFILDFDLKDPNHVRLLKIIDERFPRIPIIFMTTTDAKSSGLINLIRSLRRHGDWQLLEKPFRLDKVINAIDDLFQDGETSRTAGEMFAPHVEHEKRQEVRRHHVQPVNFSYQKIFDGDSRRIHTKGILTDISNCGTGILSNEHMQPGQVISFEEDFMKKNGIVAWSVMIEQETCRFGVQFC